MIDSYTFGRFVINKKTYESNVVLIGETIKPWRHLPDHELSMDDFSEIIDSKPEIVIIGTGASGVMPVPDEIKEFIEKKGIKLMIEKTKKACETYNNLLKQNKNIAAFLHNTC